MRGSRTCTIAVEVDRACEYTKLTSIFIIYMHVPKYNVS